MEFVERLPASFKIHRGTRKWLHKRVSNKLVPLEVIRRKKHGFAVNVVDEWFQKSLSGKLEKTLSEKNSLIYEFLRPLSVSKLLMDHQRGLRDNHKILFSMVVLEEVLRNHKTL